MKTIILYYSNHHGNTKKLVDGTAKGHPTKEEIEGAVKFYKGL